MGPFFTPFCACLCWDLFYLTDEEPKHTYVPSGRLSRVRQGGGTACLRCVCFLLVLVRVCLEAHICKSINVQIYRKDYVNVCTHTFICRLIPTVAYV